MPYLRQENCEGPEGWENDMHAPWYDPKGKYGAEIPGAISNGYTEQEVLDYFHTIEKFSSYCFNRAPSSCYAYIGFLTAWLKYYYPTEFMAAVLSMQDTPENIKFYSEVCNKMDVKVTVPDINVSKRDFTPDATHRTILYGLSAVKGVGEAALNDFIANAPYESLDDAIKRIPKKDFNKRVAEGLIKVGAFDWQDTNRIALLNQLHEARKDKIVLEDGTYEPANLKQAKALLLKSLDGYKPANPMQGALELRTTWLFPVGKSHKGGEWRITRPDTDNLRKMLKDCMTKCGYWKDDAQVVRGVVESNGQRSRGFISKLRKLAHTVS